MSSFTDLSVYLFSIMLLKISHAFVAFISKTTFIVHIITSHELLVNISETESEHEIDKRKKAT